MAPKIIAHELSRDEDYGAIKKEITVTRQAPFTTPTKCIKNLERPILDAQINEVVKKVSLRTIESFRSGYERPREITSRFVSDKLNLTIFDLMLDSVPSYEMIKSLANYWYVSSQNTLFLPTVKATMLKDNQTWSEKRILECVNFFRSLISVAEMGNFKAFIGTIPLLPIKFSRHFVKFYLDKGFNAFAIDVGTRDLLNHLGDLRSILTEINEVVSLDKAFFYACNLGIPQFDVGRATADDFLSLFAYIDAFGNTFKTKGGTYRHDTNKSRPRPKAKQFLREELTYKLLLNAEHNYNSFNQREQIKEADVVRDLIGVQKMQKYLETKKGVNETIMKHLGAVTEKIKIK